METMSLSLFDDFGRLQDTVNALMGDFGSRTVGGSRPGGGNLGGRPGGGNLGGRRRRQNKWNDTGFDDFGLGGFGAEPLLEDEGYSMPSGGLSGAPYDTSSETRQKMRDESKMDEGGDSSSALTPHQGGMVGQRYGGLNLPVLRCRVNIEELKDKYAITAEIPGFDKQNLKVNISDNNVLTISGEQKKEHVEQSKEKKFLRVERSFGRVQRSLQLPRNILKDNINASYENGILHINVAKNEEKSQRQDITIS